MITLLAGPNTYALNEALQAKVAAFKGDVERYDGTELGLKQLPDIFMGASLFLRERLIVLRDIGVNKTLWSELEPWIARVPAETDIILVELHPDKRTKTYKALQKYGQVIEYAALNEAALRSWLQAWARQQGAELSHEVVRYFISYVGHDQWRLKTEFEKLLLSQRPITVDTIREFTEPYPEASAFELLECAFDGNDQTVERLFAQLREREDPYQFFGLVSSQVMALLALEAADSRRADEIAKDMALHPFVLRKLSPVARQLGRARIVRLVERLADADSRIKLGADPWQQLEITLTGI